MDMLDKWLTIDELASYIKLSRTKLYDIAQRGETPAAKIGTQWRFDRLEIDQWMSAQYAGIFRVSHHLQSQLQRNSYEYQRSY